MSTNSEAPRRADRTPFDPCGVESSSKGSPATPFQVGTVAHGDVELYYEVHGSGQHVVVFMHGILMESTMNRRLAADLATFGYRVVLLDLPGHGHSSRPRRASYHRMDLYAEHVIAVLDHLDVDRAVLGGVSLGGNVSLLAAAQCPERVAGLVIEMPVLESAVPAAAITFVPMLLAVHFARPVVRRTATLIRRIPRTGNDSVDSVLNSFSSDPDEVAAVLHGVLAGPIAPTVDQRARMDVPALVIGHRIDHLHPFHDAEQLARRLPRARLVEAGSFLQLRLHPDRLTSAIADFLTTVWQEPPIARRRAG